MYILQKIEKLQKKIVNIDTNIVTMSNKCVKNS